VRFYLDESVSVVLASLLFQHDVDCLTAREAGHLGATDEFQLSYAAREDRTLFTHDIRDFLRLANTWHAAGRHHAGILLAHQVPHQELILRFRAFLLRYQSADLSNQVIWLPPPLKQK
jgi:predicted nuclease of predicted toxin-antitoxin system